MQQHKEKDTRIVVCVDSFFFPHIKVHSREMVSERHVHEVKEKHDYCGVIEYGLGSVNIVWVFMELLYFGYLE